MTKFQYWHWGLTIGADTENADWEQACKTMSDLGVDGWELVETIKTNHPSHSDLYKVRFLFKRAYQ